MAEHVPLDLLKSAPWNPRTITDKRFKILCDNIKNRPRFFEDRPILATKDGTIYAGNMRYRAAQHLGMTEVPAKLNDISEKEAKEEAILDNNNFGDWQHDELATLLDEMEKAGTDISTLGLDAQIEKIIEQLNQPEIVEDEAPPVPKVAKTKKGDLYMLGKHRVLCGDATNIEDVEKLMGGA